MILTRRSFLSAAAAGVSSPIWAKAITARVSDSQLLADIEHRTFNFYWERTNHSNGLMADRWPTPSSCSVRGTGFALTAWPIGVERGIQDLNTLRNASTHAFFPENLKKSKPTWKDKNIFSLAALTAFETDVRAWQANRRPLDCASRGIIS